MNYEGLIPLRLCENCQYLVNTSYEYGEAECAAGIAEEDPLYFHDGCIYTGRQLKLKAEYNFECWCKCHDGDAFAEFLESEERNEGRDGV